MRNSEMFDIFRNRMTARHLVIGFLAIGIFFRLKHYLGNRSIWFDEAMLSLNILNRSVSGLLQPLDYGQLAPIGFLIVEKLATQIFGDTEYALRLFPLAAAIAGVFLFYALARTVGETKTPVIALGLFAISTGAIYYAAEIKQYSFDITAALVLYLCAAFAAQNWKLSSFVLLTIIGTITLFFSYPSAFILAGIISCFIALCVVKRDWRKLAQILVICGIWGAIFVSAIASVFGSPTLAGMRKLWSEAFAPFPPHSTADIQWYIDKFFDIFSNPLGFTLTGLAACVFILGVAFFYKHNQKWLSFLLLPLLIAWAASTLKLYPFIGRFLLFLLPGILIIMAAGIEYLGQLTWRTERLITIVLVGLLVLQPLLNAVANASRNAPYDHENIKAILEYVATRRQPQDELYVYYGANPAFRYYRTRYGLDMMKTVYGRSPGVSWDHYLQDADTLKDHGRIWLIFSHISRDKANIDEETFLLYFLDKIGRRLDAVKAKAASGYLYDFKSPNRIS